MPAQIYREILAEIEDSKEKKRVDEFEDYVYYEMILAVIEHEDCSVDTARAIVNDADWYYDLEPREFDESRSHCEMDNYWIEY